MAGQSLDIARPVTPAPLLPMELEQAAAMMDRYRALCISILTPDDVIGVPGTQGGFVKRSGFSKLATFYGVSTEIREQHMERDDTDEGWPGKPLRARAVARATASNGRFAEGDGACAITEPRFTRASGRQKAEHDLMATAVTRATNRAISNLIGFGSVSAEEAEGTEPAASANGRPYGEAATRGEEDGLLRALVDLGASPKPANRIVHECGYLPRIAARAVMFVAAQVREQAEPEPTPEPDVEPERDVVDDLVEEQSA
jgi:hypothetical protein